VELAGTDADRVLNAMEDFAGYHRSLKIRNFGCGKRRVGRQWWALGRRLHLKRGLRTSP
jgi:hypothetical protein